MKLHHLVFTGRFPLQKKQFPSVLAPECHSQAKQEPEHHEHTGGGGSQLLLALTKSTSLTAPRISLLFPAGSLIAPLHPTTGMALSLWVSLRVLLGQRWVLHSPRTEVESTIPNEHTGTNLQCTSLAFRILCLLPHANEEIFFSEIPSPL